jgi:hypothetical protein
VLHNTYEGQTCSVARALEVVGERWTLLILRDAFLGVRRFDDFQRDLGIARNVLQSACSASSRPVSSNGAATKSGPRATSTA